MKNNSFAPHPYDDYTHEYVDGRWYLGHHRIGDTEHACEIPPWEECHPIPTDCVCVTEEDVELWNEISAVSAFKDINLDALSAISGMNIPLSAKFWNSNFETVYENSARWNEIDKIDEISAYIDATNEVLTEEIAQLKTNSLSAIHVNRERFDEDYSKLVYGKTGVLNPDYPYVLHGNGTSGMPLELSRHVVDLLYYVEHGSARTFDQNIYPNGRESVPPQPVFALAEEATSLKNDINYLYRLLLQKTGGVSNWVNKKVSLKESATSGETFFYWTTK